MRPIRIGIELGSRSIKVVWTKDSEAQAPQWHCDQRSRHASDGPEHIRQALLDLLAPLKRLRYRARVSLAAPQSHLRILNLQVPSLKEIPKALYDQMSGLFPFDPAQSQFCYRVITQRPVDHRLDCTLQAAACDARILRQDVADLWRAGWVPSHVHPMAHALAALAQAQGQLDGDPILIFDIGARRSV